MKSRMLRGHLLALILAFSMPFAAKPARARASDKPFRRALVWTGGGLEGVVFLGTLDGVTEAGWKPDVIISTCGSSLTAGLANRIPDPEQRHQFILSRDFYRILDSAQVKYDSVFGLLWDLFIRDNGSRIPDTFDTYVLNVPKTMDDPRINGPFSSSGVRAIMVSGKMLFGPEDVGEPMAGRKLYRETYFTDPDTGRWLGGLESAMNRSFPDSAIARETEVMTTATTYQAGRASIADPYLMQPMEIDGARYVTGGVNLYPLELANAIADEVAMTDRPAFTATNARGVKNAFGFDAEARRQQILKGKVDHWIDLGDEEEFEKENALDPGARWVKEENPHDAPSYSYRIVSGLPKKLGDFQRIIENQWQRGRERGRRAILEGAEP